MRYHGILTELICGLRYSRDHHRAAAGPDESGGLALVYLTTNALQIGVNGERNSLGGTGASLCEPAQV